MAKKSETLSQRAKAQRDIIELKKMQAGQLDPGPKPSEVAVAPKTFKEKKDNFLYHYKYLVILAAFLVVVGIVVGVDLATKIRYDSKVVVFSYDPIISICNNQIADYFEEFYPDVNGNGKVEIAAIDCTFDPEDKNFENRTAKQAKLQTALTTERDALIYILDDRTIEYFKTVNQNIEIFKAENIVELGEDFYKFIGLSDTGYKTKLYAALRTVDGTLLEGKDKTALDSAKNVMQSLKQAGGLQ